MSKPIIYGTSICPDCVEIKKYLSTKDFEYEYIDITENISNLKSFLSLRDTRAEFDDVKANKYVGIPAMYMDDKIYFYEDIQELVK